MGWTRPGTVTTDDFISETTWNTSVADTRDFLHKAPFVHAYVSADVDIAHNTATDLSFDAEYHDTDGIHDTVTNNDQFTIQTAGVYAMSASCRWESVAGTSLRILGITVNTVTVAEETRRIEALNNDMNVSTVYLLAASDVVRVNVYQNSGGSLAVQYAEAFPAQFAMQWLAAGTA